MATGTADVPASVSTALRAFLDVQSIRAQLYARFNMGHKAFMRTKAESTFRVLMADTTNSFSDCSRKVIALEAALKELGRADLAALLREVQESERDKLRLTLTLQALKQAVAWRAFSWQQQGADGEGQQADDEEALALLDPHYKPHGHGHGHGQEGHSHSHSGQDGQEQSGPAGGTEQGHGTGPGAAAEGEGGGGEAEVGAPQANVCRLANGNGHLEEGQEEEGQEEEGQGKGQQLQGHGQGREQEPAQGNGQAHTHTHGGGCGCGGGGGGPPEPTRREFEAAVKEATQELDACIRNIIDTLGDLRMELEEEEQ